ncbi:GPW/gp25 family protein [Crocosphaera sp.]|uniref:GPW/gp25 family protein n=1 Tax=Crocosphaera sp. TaxID=2729996 RepID=UPI003F250045|nr:GPW/gp25 family protein [Crocosphaera sp.]
MTDPIYTSFLGTGWSFPPEFLLENEKKGEVLMTADEEDIQSSLKILFGTAIGERFFNPKFGLDLKAMLFEPMSTTIKTALIDNIKIAILIYESRIEVLSLDLDTTAQNEGKIEIVMEYKVRATNSRYNLVYPFSITER